MKKMILTVCAVMTGLVLGLACLSIYLGHQQAALLTEAPSQGTVFIIEADLSSTPDTTNAMATLKESMRNRFARFGTRIFWEPISKSRIRISIPISDAQASEAAEILISHRGFLEFHLVHENSNELVQQGEVPPGYEVLKCKNYQSDGEKRVEAVLVKTEAEHGLAGGIIRSATVMAGAHGELQIEFELTPASTAVFAEVTQANIGHRLAILLDGELYSAPVIQSQIETGSGQITGHFDRLEAKVLANLMEHPLPVPVTVVQLNTI